MITKVKIIKGPQSLYPIFVFNKRYAEKDMIKTINTKLVYMFEQGEEKEMFNSIINHARYECDLEDDIYSDLDVLYFIIENEAYVDFEIEGE